MESYIAHFDFSAAFNRANHSGLFFKLKYIGVGGSVLSICTEFLTDRWLRVVVDGAASEWIPIIFRLAMHREVRWVFFCLSYIYQRNV